METVTSTVPVPGRAGARCRCVGCAGLVPDEPGPVHPYMRASPGCWQLYGQLSARVMTTGGAPDAAWHHVDAYAVQHPDNAQTDRRQRQSVAVHLVSLCLLHEHSAPPHRAPAQRRRISERVLPRVGLPDWPYLPPPPDLGAVTAADVHAADGAQQFAELLALWTQSAWSAWAAHHDTVRGWAAATWPDRP